MSPEPDTLKIACVFEPPDYIELEVDPYNRGDFVIRGKTGSDAHFSRHSREQAKQIRAWLKSYLKATRKAKH